MNRSLAAGARSVSSRAQPSSLLSPRPRIPPEIVNQKRPESELALEDTEAVDEDEIRTVLSSHALSLVYTSTTPPALSSLAALASRLLPSAPLPLPLLEQALIHPSFWIGVSTLPANTSPIPRSFTLHHDSLRASNSTLATLGNSLLGTLTAELVIASFPHLPTRVSKAAITKYVGPKSLAAVAQAWGVAPSRLERSIVGVGAEEDQKRMKRSEKAYGHLVGGRGGARRPEKSAEEGAAGAGLIRWNRKSRSIAEDAILFEDALASVSRAIVGAIYQAHGFAATRTFVHSHFLSRLLPSSSSPLASPSAIADLTPLLKFTSPTTVLAHALKKQHWNFPNPPSHRLLKESGRLSSRATFLSGVYSGSTKLGEGRGPKSTPVDCASRRTTHFWLRPHRPPDFSISYLNIMSTQDLCAVCPLKGSLRCSSCKAVRFCGPQHQTLLWSSHKVLCQARSPLVFNQREPTPAELADWKSTQTQESYESYIKPDDNDILMYAETPLFRNVHRDTVLLKQPKLHPQVPHDAFVQYASLFDAFAGLRKTESETGATPAVPFLRLNALDEATRDKFKVQALVLLTLVAKEAREDFVQLAVERLSAIVGGDPRLMDPVQDRISVMAVIIREAKGA
ncbi:hypothetical protein RQP46_001827 [Phenoliferia psychrophenolica]